MIITSDDLLQSVKPLADHKSATGMPTGLFTVKYAKSRFPNAVDDAEAVKRLIEWGSSQGYRYVMLAGNGMHVPVRFRYVRGPEQGNVGYSYNPSDLYYANIYRNHRKDGTLPSGPKTFETWDGNNDGYFNEEKWYANSVNEHNPDGVDGYPDIIVGRVPAANSQEMSRFVNKVITYETWPSMSGAQNAAFLIDKDYQGANSMAQQIEAPLLPSKGINSHIGLSYSAGNPAPYPFNSGNAQTVADATQQSGWVFYVGHGDRNGWGGGGFNNQQVNQRLSNTKNYPVVFAASCETGQFTPDISLGAKQSPPKAPVYQDGRCFASDWLFHPAHAGAIAYFGESLVGQNNWGTSLATYLTKEIAKGNKAILGDAYLNAQRNYWLNEGGANEIGAPRIFLGIMNFFGDPSLRLRPAPIDKHDFNRDGQNDLLFHNVETGEIQAWFMYGTDRIGYNSIKEQSTQQAHSVVAPWRITTTGRVNNDNFTDLFLYNSDSGITQTWFMNGTDRVNYNNVKELGASPMIKFKVLLPWWVIDAGYFDNDDQIDLLWYNQTTGEMNVWFMSGTDRKSNNSVKEQSTQKTHYLSSDWIPKACGDMNLDGQVDILLQNTITGDLQVWFMNGTDRVSFNSIKEQSTQKALIATDPWQFVGMSKINEDAWTDLVFHNKTTGEIQVWFMLGTDRIGYNSVKEQSTQKLHYVKYPWEIVGQ